VTWTLFWYIKAAMAWLLSLSGALGWGRGNDALYLFVLTLTVALTIVAVHRFNLDASRRQSWRNGWEAAMQALQGEDEDPPNVRRIGRR